MNFKIFTSIISIYLFFVSFLLSVYYLEVSGKYEKNQFKKWKTHYHISQDYSKTEIKPLKVEEKLLVSGIDIHLYDALQSLQNELFAGVFSGQEDDEIQIQFLIPADISNNEKNLFIKYQAISYALILKKLLPDSDLKTIHFTAMRRSPLASEETHFSFSINALLNEAKGDYVKRGWNNGK